MILELGMAILLGFLVVGVQCIFIGATIILFKEWLDDKEDLLPLILAFGSLIPIIGIDLVLIGGYFNL